MIRHWSWRIERDGSYFYWVPIVSTEDWRGAWGYVFVHTEDSDDIKSQDIGRHIVKLANEIDPTLTTVYRLAYGSLP